MMLRQILEKLLGREFPGKGQDDAEGGVGVPVPVGPRPIRGGAQAKPPVPQEDEELEKVGR